MKTVKLLDSNSEELTQEQKKIIDDYMQHFDLVKGNDLCYMEWNNTKEFEEEVLLELYEDEDIEIKRPWLKLLTDLGIKDDEMFILNYSW